MRIYPAVSKSQVDILDTGEGLLGETFDRIMMSSAQTPTSGTVYSTLIGLRAGTVVANISVICAATAAGVTLLKVGLYNTAGTQLASSAESSASFNSSGLKTLAMTTPYTIPADGVYYCSFISVTGGSNPTIAGTGSFTNRNLPVGSSPRRTSDQSGQTDLPSPATFANGTVGLWFGIS